MTPNTEEYLRGFLPLCFLHSMDEASEDALADVLADYILNTASEVCDVERCAAPDENLVMGYAADLAGADPDIAPAAGLRRHGVAGADVQETV